MRNGLGDANRVGVGDGSMDVKFDNVRCAFAVSNDLTGKRCADLCERGGEFAIALTDTRAARARCEQEDGVIG